MQVDISTVTAAHPRWDYSSTKAQQCQCQCISESFKPHSLISKEKTMFQPFFQFFFVSLLKASLASLLGVEEVRGAAALPHTD